jgi:hypothetical protein
MYPRSLVERLVGRTWAATVNLGAGDSLEIDEAVACLPDRTCVAVGMRATTAQEQAIPMAEVLLPSGMSKSLSPAPVVGAGFDAVSCPSSNWCMAVGSRYHAPSSATTTFSEVYEGGGKWRVLSVPNF